MVTYRARYVFPVDRPPIEDGVVTLDGGRIVDVRQFAADTDAIDLGEVAVIPGLVNAHTHLEFSDLEKPLGEPGMSLPWWIREVIEHRSKRGGEQPHALRDPLSLRDPIDLGIKESARCGVTSIAEIAMDASAYVSKLLEMSLFLELRAFRKQDIDKSMEAAKLFFMRHGAGLSPHAPYSVHHDLFQAAIDLAGRCGKMLVMHIAESTEELQLLQTAGGPFRDLLEERGWWEREGIALGLRPLDYLQELSYVNRSMVIHGNYLNDEEIRFVGIHRDRMSIVYCPRTHEYFGHERYPLRSMLSNGVRVALGTDSRASNPDLDVRKEMQLVIERHAISPEQALRFGTVHGAEAMGVHDVCGTISAGKSANLAVIQLPNGKPNDQHELLFHPDAKVIATICRGRVVFSEHAALMPLPSDLGSD